MVNRNIVLRPPTGKCHRSQRSGLWLRSCDHACRLSRWCSSCRWT